MGQSGPRLFRFRYGMLNAKPHQFHAILPFASPSFALYGNPMTVLTVEELCSQIKPGKPLAGLDLGTKTIGLAISDIGWRLANPKSSFKGQSSHKDSVELQRQLKYHNCLCHHHGLPLNMDGSEGPRAQATRAFVRNMERQTELPFVFP